MIALIEKTWNLYLNERLQTCLKIDKTSDKAEDFWMQNENTEC